MGSEVYIRVTGLTIVGASDYTCNALRTNAPWYRATIPPWFCEFSSTSSSQLSTPLLIPRHSLFRSLHQYPWVPDASRNEERPTSSRSSHLSSFPSLSIPTLIPLSFFLFNPTEKRNRHHGTRWLGRIRLQLLRWESLHRPIRHHFDGSFLL